jgi:hypothetical protein
MPGFQHDVAGGQGNLIIPQLQSPNFDLATQTGWAVLRNGNAYFFNVTATGAVTATEVIAEGPGAGVFVYDGAAGPGTLVVAIASQAGTDKYGNAYSGPGIAISAPGLGGGKNEIQIRPDLNAVLIYAP